MTGLLENISELLSVQEKAWFAGESQPDFVQQYQQSETFFTLEKLERLLKKNIKQDELPAWQDEIQIFQEAYLRYYYFLQKWYSTEDNSSLRMELAGRYSMVKRLYAEGQNRFYYFVDGKSVKSGGEAKAIADWFTELKQGFQRLCPADQEK